MKYSGADERRTNRVKFPVVGCCWMIQNSLREGNEWYPMHVGEVGDHLGCQIKWGTL